MPSWNVFGWKEDVTDLDLTLDVDAPSMGYDANWFEWCTRAIHAKKMRFPARSRSQRWVDTLKLLESELTDCSRETRSDSCIRRWMVALGVE